MSPSSWPSEHDSGAPARTEQRRKDTARVLYTMVPHLPPPLVSLCLNYYLGPEKGKTVRRTARPPALSMDTPRFKLRRMSSGPMGELSLVSPINSTSDKRGFGNHTDLTFAIELE